MLLGTRKTLYDHIIEALLGNSLTVHQIQGYLNTQKIPASVQGIYKTLRELIREDIVVKQKITYSVSNVWKNKMEKLVSRESVFKLFPGEQAQYRFNKIENTDAFWKHTFQNISDEIGSFPVFHFTPHQYWLMIPTRRKSEEEYYQQYDIRKVHIYSIIGGESSFDMQKKKELLTPFHKISCDRRTNFNRRDHLAVFGSYIITTRVSINFARATDYLYETCPTESELAEKLLSVFKKSGTITMIVEHNEPKAKKLRKRLSADFHIPRELRERFDLF